MTIDKGLMDTMVGISLDTDFNVGELDPNSPMPFARIEAYNHDLKNAAINVTIRVGYIDVDDEWQVCRLIPARTYRLVEQDYYDVCNAETLAGECYGEAVPRVILEKIQATDSRMAGEIGDLLAF